jgi:NAD(P)-dependent dehydrogenase (short-subunit alcohol dehydrogenase family)
MPSSSRRSGPLAPGYAFITGGARGLGNAIAVSFAKDGAAGVALVDILDESAFAEGKAAVEAYGTMCITIHADVTDESQVEKAVATAVEAFGRIDYAANFAGIAGPLTAVTETDTEQWKKVINVNAIGVWLSMKHELKQMIKQESIAVEDGRVEQKGSIVNCASVNSIQAGAGASGYTAAKHAVLGMTKAGALEGRSQGVRINCVSPGFLRTKLLEEEFKKATGKSMLSGEEGDAAWGAFEARQGRKATFNEVGDVVVLLSTPRMSLVVGHNLVIDGGFTINEMLE